MKDYNGFSTEERMIIHNKQKAMGLHVEVAKKPCSICEGSGGFIMCHTEDYRNLYDVRPICVECHMKLHVRFSRPGVWIKHLIDLKNSIKPKQWKTVGEYFYSQKSERFIELQTIDPATIGEEWYHKLLMTKINLNEI